MRVVIVGARRVRTGTGPFLAREFSRLGHRIVGVVGTTEESAEQAKKDLSDSFSITCRAFTSLSTAITATEPSVVVVASPAATHFSAIQTALVSGCHVFCEKPLWWAEDYTSQTVNQQTQALLTAALTQHLLLDVNTQWPFSLPAFYETYPDVRGEQVRRFCMRMCTNELTESSVMEYASHPLSMLDALVGPGAIDCIRSIRHKDGLDLVWLHKHSAGDTGVFFELRERPRPHEVSYDINGSQVIRRGGDPNAPSFYTPHGKVTAFPDPLKSSVEQFCSGVRNGRLTDAPTLHTRMAQLRVLIAACAGDNASAIMG